jgi:hypothetical protein
MEDFIKSFVAHLVKFQLEFIELESPNRMKIILKTGVQKPPIQLTVLVLKKLLKTMLKEMLLQTMAKSVIISDVLSERVDRPRVHFRLQP